MLSLSGRPSARVCSTHGNRREFLRLGGLTVGGLTLANLAAAGTAPKKAKSCILIFMDGGPSHLETFDMKPNAPVEVRGEFRPIRSTVPGSPVCELLPRLAGQMHHFAQVRSVHHTVTDHNAGSYFMLAGRSPVENGRLILTDSGSTFPSIGSAVAKLRPPTAAVPPYVLLPEFQWNNGVDIPGQKAGFLGPRYDPFVGGDPSLPGYKVPGLELPPEISLDRLGDRTALHAQLDRTLAGVPDPPNVDRAAEYRRQAMDVIRSAKTRRAFDLSQESPAVRDRYGRDPGSDRSLEARKFGGLPHIGQTMLLARRLVEAGVRLVTVVTGRRIDQAWDTHRDHFTLMRRALCPPFDQALSALLEDLVDRGLLDETLVVVMGEFGRTPRIGQVTSNAGANKYAGRDHWPFCFTVLFAGGGIPGGAVYGSSDAIAAQPRDNPVTPDDVAATIYAALGIDPATELHDNLNRPYTLSAGTPIRALLS
jgi:hypothetical protein